MQNHINMIINDYYNDGNEEADDLYQINHVNGIITTTIFDIYPRVNKKLS